MAHSTEQTVLFPALVSKPVVVQFDEPQVTSDGGALLELPRFSGRSRPFGHATL